jgi:UDP-glucose 4-epimerase
VIVADACDAEAVDAALGGVTDVIYAAGGLMPSESERDPVSDAALTLRPLLTVLNALANRAASFTLISSGGTVYGEPQRLPVDETHPTEPISSYGVIKLAVEKFVSVRAWRDSLRARILRCANVYGEGQPADRDQGAIATFTSRLANRETAVLYGDGQAVRDYVYVRDVVDAALALIERPSRPLVVNVGSGRGYSLAEVIASIERVSGERLLVERYPARNFDITEIVLDIARLRALIDFEPTPLNEGIRRVLTEPRHRRPNRLVFTEERATRR